MSARELRLAASCIAAVILVLGGCGSSRSSTKLPASEKSSIDSLASSALSSILASSSGQSPSSDDEFLARARAKATGPYAALTDQQLFQLMGQICVAIHGTGLPSPAPASGPSLRDVFDKAPVQPPGSQAEQDAMVEAARVECP